MGHRDSILKAAGYSARYETRPGYRGHHNVTVCMAERDGQHYFAFTDPGPCRRIRAVQDRIPHMARITDVVRDVVVFEAAPGRLLWDLDGPFSPGAVDSIERQLLAFAEGTKAARLTHGDLRPWNVMVADDGSVRVIDWSLSAFASDLTLGHPHLTGHYTTCHRELRLESICDMDLRDAQAIVRLLRRSTRYSEEFGRYYGPPGAMAPWCRS